MLPVIDQVNDDALKSIKKRTVMLLARSCFSLLHQEAFVSFGGCFRSHQSSGDLPRPNQAFSLLSRYLIGERRTCRPEGHDSLMQ